MVLISVRDPAPFFTGSRLPLTKAQLPAPGNRFYNYLFRLLLRLWLPLKRPGSRLSLKRPGSGSPTLVLMVLYVLYLYLVNIIILSIIISIHNKQYTYKHNKTVENLNIYIWYYTVDKFKKASFNIYNYICNIVMKIINKSFTSNRIELKFSYFSLFMN